ncbi:O-antigen ligase family protein [Aliterella atlantica]|uniref:Glucose-6-phosphate isomerase n=1 Tax=Aliterella atlantica CENA595 TaxID=1618023 RepID=A0A0D8ZNN9_9CYAN|nr:O-antigen ligase family protein [Aliterella atlantica]KJH69967.1 glucose-6-phosphate isomerase [Aliterella atlantica CENA595]
MSLTSSSVSTKPSTPALLAWIVIVGFSLFTAVAVLAGAGSIMRLLFPLLSLAVGLFLYGRYPIIYVGFTWWLWFITPWLRRIIDYRSGWDGNGIILVAPFLVTLITFITFVQYLPRSYKMGGLPIVLAIIGVIYGFFIGAIKNPLTVSLRALLDWLTPILLAFHLFVNWRNYPKYRENLQSTFTWGLLITGVYGVIQYLVAPEWDRYWIIQTKLLTNGAPEPLGIRVFSTMNSPGPFANVVLAGLLILLTNESFWRVPAMAAGYMSFLLSLVRSAWAGWFLGIISLFAFIKPRLQMQLVVTILAIALCVLPLATIEPFSEIISARLETFTNLQKDTSYNERSELYEKNVELAFSSGLGRGIGSKYYVNEEGLLQEVTLDSGILDIFFTLGWFGAIPYIGGMALVVFELFKSDVGRSDAFASAARAIGLSILAQLLFGSVMLALSGVVFWSFLGIGMAANKYHQNEKALKDGRRV